MIQNMRPLECRTGLTNDIKPVVFEETTAEKYCVMDGESPWFRYLDDITQSMHLVQNNGQAEAESWDRSHNGLVAGKARQEGHSFIYHDGM
jgi:hypothetical protein